MVQNHEQAVIFWIIMLGNTVIAIIANFNYKI